MLFFIVFSFYEVYDQLRLSLPSCYLFSGFILFKIFLYSIEKKKKGREKRMGKGRKVIRERERGGEGRGKRDSRGSSPGSKLTLLML